MKVARAEVAWRGVLVAVLLAGSACRPQSTGTVGTEGQTELPRFRNLLLVVVDTLRSDHLPSYGYARATAPRLARLAEEGIQVQGYAVSSWTRPSMATLLTGLHPQRHQTISRADALPADTPYLPEILADHGFDTAAYMGNLNAGRQWGFARGVARYRETRGVYASDADATTVTDRVLGLELRPPFYLQVLYIDPHDPYRPPEPWCEDGNSQGCDTSQAALDTTPLQPKDVMAKGRPFARADLDRLIRQYDGEILDVDTQIGRLLDGLAKRGLLDDTLVVVTSDHGEEFGEHGHLTHGKTLHEELLQVPMILWSPGWGESGMPSWRGSEPLHHVDLLPTLLDALGVEIPRAADGSDLDGTSRWQELANGALEMERDLYFHLDLERRAALALRHGETKLIHQRRRPSTRVYDLEADPSERHATPPDTAARDLLRRLVEHHNTASAHGAGRTVEETDAALRRELEALGYLDAGTSEEELRERTLPPRLDPERGLGR